jgi:hypothetical protein
VEGVTTGCHRCALQQVLASLKSRTQLSLPNVEYEQHVYRVSQQGLASSKLQHIGLEYMYQSLLEIHHRSMLVLSRFIEHSHLCPMLMMDTCVEGVTM